MDLPARLELIKRLPTEEIITEEELIDLLKTKKQIIAYDGFEPSGLAHLGSGILRAIKLNDFIQAGCKFKLFIADWFAFINNKMGGDLEKIRKVGKYLIEVWQACGVDKEKIEIVWADDLISQKDYWQKVFSIAKVTSLKRMLRCSPIMGRKEEEMIYTAQLFYPAMQAADPFQLKVDICQLGMDQRHATILSREVAKNLGFKPPICIHHHLLAGLLGGQRMGPFDLKMSKSKSESCIFVHDSDEEIRNKIRKAFCPERITEGNPVLEICKYIIFRKFDSLEIKRPEKYGGEISYASYQELEKDYLQGNLFPLDLKESVVEYLIKILRPIRKYFSSPSRDKIVEEIKSWTITK